MLSRLWTTLIIALAVMLPTTLSAEPGDGLETGNLILSPGATFSAAFDTNIFRLSVDERAPIGAPYVQLVPFLKISSVNGDIVDFRVDGSVGWQQYVPIGERVVLGQSGLKADVGLDLVFNRAGAFSFAIGERLQRTNEAPSEPDAASYNRLVNRLGATMGLHPGGRVFQHFLSYDWNVYLYDQFPDLNKTVHDFTLKNYWRFLPKTAVVLNGDFQIVQYSQQTREEGYVNINSTPLRINGGLSGLITRRMSVRLLGGWGIGFYDANESFNSFLIDTQLAYAFGNLAEKNKLFLGYERNFQDSSIANFASYHRPYAGYEQGFSDRRLSLSIRVEALIREYEGEIVGDFLNPAGDTISINEGLDDLLINAGVGLDFNIYKWWSVGARYGFSANLTDDIISVNGSPEIVREYVRHLVSLNTTVRY